MTVLVLVGVRVLVAVVLATGFRFLVGLPALRSRQSMTRQDGPQYLVCHGLPFRLTPHRRQPLVGKQSSVTWRSAS